ncbi:hypothetical protein PPYR_14653 [Photinus pyralis]|uniref:MD-2-related lipid-recognition domain-containing protein n=2 Tax=Photinus pyralis TaxID=7054 RepID=A0A5N4A5S7_PHOPY|nr:uncharacterized protein LOC116181436 [Photinus pyralis]KAB0792694.1 hypothetical protein PPYR_14653 [Photinus pyralis]
MQFVMRNIHIVYYFVLFSTFACDFPQYFQNDYVVKYERHLVHFYNEKYIRYNLTYSKVSKTSRRLLFTVDVLQEIGTNAKFVLEALKFTSNEYRRFGFRHEEHPCSFTFTDSFGFSYKNSDTNLTTCPTKKGTYYLRDPNLDQSRFPPFVPRGRFMLNGCIYVDDALLTNISVYIKIVPTNPLEVVIN